MNLKEALLQEHSKEQTMRIVNYINSRQDLFDQLFSLFMDEEYRIVQRASWAVNFCVEHHPNFIHGHYEELIHALKYPKHDAVKRNVLRLIQFVNIPEDYHGQFYDLAFSFASSTKEPVAIRVFSLSLLYDISKNEPVLLSELEELLTDCARSDSAGMQARVRKIRKLISKQRK